MIKRICIFGDSIAFGGNDRELGGWSTRLKIWFHNIDASGHVFNLAIPSKNSNDIL